MILIVFEFLFVSTQKLLIAC